MYHFASLYKNPGDYIAAKATDTGNIIIDYDKVSEWPEYKSDIELLKSIQLTNLEINSYKKNKKNKLEKLSLHSLLWIVRKAILCRLTYIMTDVCFKKILQNINYYEQVDLHQKILQILSEKSVRYNHYSKMYKLITTFIPEETQFLSNGINANMITAYFPSSNELIFAFRGIEDNNSNLFQKNIKINCGEDYNNSNSTLTENCKKIANNITQIYIIKKHSSKPLSIQTTGHSLGGIIALKAAIKIKACCVGFNVGGRGYCINPSRIFLKEKFIHIHNPKDTFSNYFVKEEYNFNSYPYVYPKIKTNKLFEWISENCSKIFSNASYISKSTIYLDTSKISRQNLIQAKNTQYEYHNLENIILEIEERIIQTIFTEKYLSQNMLTKQKNRYKNIDNENIDYSRICLV